MSSEADVLINMVPIRMGGGLQNSLSFLTQLARREDSERMIVACTEGSAVEDLCRQLGLKYIAFRGGPLGRLQFEVWDAYRLVRTKKVATVFTIFGNPPLRCGKARKISGFAFSNIIMEEVPFWNFLSPWRRLLAVAKDKVRLVLSLRADEIILETDYLRERAAAGVFAKKVLHVVKMEPSALVQRDTEVGTPSRSSRFTIACVAGAHPNKRVHLLAPVVARLLELGFPCKVLTTMPSSATYFQEVEEAFRDQGVADSLENLGPVKPQEVASVLAAADAVANISLLESFSNNWVEAWATHKLLISTDAEWARRSCGSAAIYIDPIQFDSAARTILTSISHRQQFYKAGSEQLRLLARDGKKIDRYLAIINHSKRISS